MELIMKIAGIGILTAVIDEILAAQGKKGFSQFVTIAAVALCMGLTFDKVSSLINTVVSTFRLY